MRRSGKNFEPSAPPAPPSSLANENPENMMCRHASSSPENVTIPYAEATLDPIIEEEGLYPPVMAEATLVPNEEERDSNSPPKDNTDALGSNHCDERTEMDDEIESSSTMLIDPFLTRRPVDIVCPNCNQKNYTKVEHSAECMSFGYCTLLFCFCCPFFWVPFASNNLKTTYHYCKVCNYMVGHVYPHGCGPAGGRFRGLEKNADSVRGKM